MIQTSLLELQYEPESYAYSEKNTHNDKHIYI